MKSYALNCSLLSEYSSDSLLWVSLGNREFDEVLDESDLTASAADAAGSSATTGENDYVVLEVVPMPDEEVCVCRYVPSPSDNNSWYVQVQ